MTDLKQRMLEDRAIRDAAKILLDADIVHVKNAFSGPSLTERAASNLSDGAKEVFDKASSAADDHKGILAALVGAVLIWIARNPLLDLLFGQASEEDTADESSSDHDRKGNNSVPSPEPPQASARSN